MKRRKTASIHSSEPVREGAGVHLHRAFDFGKTSSFDPFLLFDDFRGDRPDQFRAGFPWHPHRGIETVTYMLAGTVEHGDSIGNSGTLGPGDIQWMTAGSGIIHQEMPHEDNEGKMYGFQLWVNLPAELKMTEPRYQDVSASKVPEVNLNSLNGQEELAEGYARVLCGSFLGKTGPVEGIAAEPRYLDIVLPPNTAAEIPMDDGYTAFVYVYGGTGSFTPEGSDTVTNRNLVRFHSEGDALYVSSGETGLRFLLISGKPLKEPVAWRGPIVMNTDEELRTAFHEYHNGIFLKHQHSDFSH